MRIWSLHPRYLDPAGLVALWREALLAKAVLDGKTKGYRHHPQLERFQQQAQPSAAINAYLLAVHEEATTRGYRFDPTKIDPPQTLAAIPVASGQLDHEWAHLRGKLALRSPAVLERWSTLQRPDCHPLFQLVPGPLASWERV
ncbi:MAG: pyrimidine dimer DNA glycosylase/endonuclease V [Lysobacteraceae bacterium]